jgi:hypothetical protein
VTPLVQKMSRAVPEADTFTWFDIGDAQRLAEDEDICGDRLVCIPFPRTAICWSQADFDLVLLLCSSSDNSVEVGVQVLHNNKWSNHSFAYASYKGVLHVGPYLHPDVPSKKIMSSMLNLIDLFLDYLATARTAYRANASDTFINRKRAAKGRAPMLTWHTLTVEPQAAGKEPQGGTHASPRKHDRRGHWRALKGGRQTWVKQCVVGDASRGLVMKDYLVRGVS